MMTTHSVILHIPRSTSRLRWKTSSRIHLVHAKRPGNLHSKATTCSLTSGKRRTAVYRGIRNHLRGFNRRSNPSPRKSINSHFLAVKRNLSLCHSTSNTSGSRKCPRPPAGTCHRDRPALLRHLLSTMRSWRNRSKHWPKS